jgi:Uma2 family endonuclease
MLRTLLLLIFQQEYQGRYAVGSDQFVYWNATDPKRTLAPDLFVRLDTPQTDFDSWKTWERGSPQLAVEIASEFDRSEESWSRKLSRYQELGVSELCLFDADATSGNRIRIWDRIEGDLVERVVETDITPCRTLGLFWVVQTGFGYPIALRLARDEEGRDLLLPREDAEARAREAAERAREAAERAREAAERARETAERARDDEARGRKAAERELASARAEIDRLKRGKGGPE